MDDTQDTIKAAGHVYNLTKKLGAGLTGNVFLVNEEGRSEPLALKLLNPEAYKEGQLELFKHEFSVLSALHHPHLCRVYDFGFYEKEQKHFFTSEYIEGGDLYQCTDELTYKEIEELLVQILDGLSAVHAAGLIHLDIKGANILVTKIKGKPFIKLVDFGLATPAVEVPKFVAGTVRYISPEMITHSSDIDYRSDLYSLGIVLYRMLARKYPNQGSSMEEVLKWHTKHKLVDEEPLLKLNVPRYLIDVVQKLTDPIPTNRFSSANVILKFLELHSGKSYKKIQKEELTTLIEEGPLVGRDDLMRKIGFRIKKLGEKTAAVEANHTLAIIGSSGIGKSRILKETKYLAEINELNIIEIAPEKTGAAILLANIKNLEPLCVLIDDFDRLPAPFQQAVAGLWTNLHSDAVRKITSRILILSTFTIATQDEEVRLPYELGIEDAHLTPLTPENIEQYIRQFLGESEPDSKLVNEIYAYSGGIPELMQIAVAGIESGAVAKGHDINRMFMDRIKPLSKDALLTFGVIGLLDKSTTSQILESIMGSNVDEQVFELIRTGLIRYDRKTLGIAVSTGAITRSLDGLLKKDILDDAAGKLYEYTLKNAASDVDAQVKYARYFMTEEKFSDVVFNAALEKDKIYEVGDSLKYYELFLNNAEEKNPKIPDVLRKLAHGSILTRNLEKAKQYIDRASSITSMTKDDYVSMGWIARLSNNPKEALLSIEKAMKLADEKKDQIEFLRLTNEKAECLIQMGNFAEAEKLFSETLKAIEALPESERTKVPNNNLGLALALQGNFEAAIDFYTKKLAVFKNDKRIAASVLSRLGYIYQQADKYVGAYNAYRQALSIAHETGDTHNASIILGNLVCICQSKALFSDALGFAMEGLKLGASEGFSRKHMGGSFLMIGGLYIYLGLEDIAARYLSDATKIFTEIKDEPMLAWTKLAIAFMHRNVGEYENSIRQLAGVIEIAKRLNLTQLLDVANNNAAEIYIETNEFTKAREHLNQIKSTWPGMDKAKESDVQFELMRLKLAVAAGSSSESVIERALELEVFATKLGLRELAAEIYQLLAKEYELKGDTERGMDYIQKAKAILDDISKTLTEEYRDSYLKHRFRKDISDESIRLTGTMKDIPVIKLDEESKSEKKNRGKDIPESTANLSENDLEGTKNLKK